MFNYKNYIFPLFILAVLTSCEGATNRNYTLSNKSEYPITAKGTSINSDFEFHLGPQEEMMFLSFEEKGGTDLAGHPSDYIFDLLIYNAEDTCFKDFSDPTKWYLISEELDKVPSNWKHSFLFEVKTTDF
jgi:hypothetical protein